MLGAIVSDEVDDSVGVLASIEVAVSVLNKVVSNDSVSVLELFES